jgi:pyridoxal phosphate enzyme (YggS family)
VNDIAENIRSIREKIALAAAACGRVAGDITLVAITKTFPEASISEAIAAGIRQFGENRVQEAEGKILHFRGFPGLEWHLVGHLQSNKTRRAAELFDVIHSLDSVKLAARLDQAAKEIGKTISVLIQVDLGGEETKFGAPPDRLREMLDALSPLTRLRPDGLMTIPPYFENPDEARPYFAGLRKLSESLEAEQPGCLGLRHLSMGMSHDFEAAIQEGATMVRIGTAIFGSRQNV